MLFISIHKIEGRYWKYWLEIYGKKKHKKDATFYRSFYLSSEELISTDQSVQTYFKVFGFCQTLIFVVTFQEKYFWKVTSYSAKICLFPMSSFLNSVSFGVISGIKCCQLNEFDAS